MSAGAQAANVIVIDAGSTGTRLWRYDCEKLSAAPLSDPADKFGPLAGTMGKSPKDRDTEGAAVAKKLAARITQLNLPAVAYGTAGFLESGRKYGDALRPDFAKGAAGGRLKESRVVNEGPFAVAGLKYVLTDEQFAKVKTALETGGASAQFGENSRLVGATAFFNRHKGGKDNIPHACKLAGSKLAPAESRGCVNQLIKFLNADIGQVMEITRGSHAAALGGISYAADLYEKIVGPLPVKKGLRTMNVSHFAQLTSKACGVHQNEWKSYPFFNPSLGSANHPCYVAAYYEAIYTVSPYMKIDTANGLHDAWTRGAAEDACKQHTPAKVAKK